MRALIAILAATIGGIAMFIGLFAACAGFAWIFVFGDNSRPSWSSAVLILIPAAGAMIGILVFTTIALLLLLHVAAAIQQQFFEHDRTAGRMPPFQAPLGEQAVIGQG